MGLGLDLILISWLRIPLPHEQYKFRLQTVTCSPITLPPTPSWAAHLNQESEFLLFPYVEKGSWVLILIRTIDSILLPLLGHQQYPHVSCGSVSDCAQDQYYAFCSICSCVLIGLLSLFLALGNFPMSLSLCFLSLNVYLKFLMGVSYSAFLWVCCMVLCVWIPVTFAY